MSEQLDFTEVYAVPGKSSIIDGIHPATGLTIWCQQTETQIRAREPLAVRMSWADWQAAEAARQHAPIVWAPTTAARYDEMLNVLPPAFWAGGLFLVGEPTDHDVTTGAPRFTAYYSTNESSARYFEASRPITRAEARAQLATVSAQCAEKGGA